MEAPEIISLIESKEKGSTFLKSDLHIHTSASHDYETNGTTAKEIIDDAISKEIKLIAITDHNSVEFCNEIIKYSKNKNITVFPGIELSTIGGKQGLHFIVIFPKDKKIREIQDCLAQIGLGSTKQGNLDELSTKSTEEIFKIIKENNGLIIGAHAYNNKGIINDMKGQQRIKLIQDINLSGIEINDVEQIKFFKGDDPNYKRVLACIQSSDAHNISDIGKRYTLLKMECASFEGIRQALADPQSRIRFDNNTLHQHPFVSGIYIEGGFLDGNVFSFNEDMNSIIGGKGTGKTTALELIRFALSSKHKDKKIHAEFNTMVEQILEGGIVHVLVNSKENQKYLISRKFGEKNQIFREDGSLLNLSSSDFEDFFSIEAYSQGELIIIARSVENQLEMIDKYIDIKSLQKDEIKFKKNLSKNAIKLIHLQDKIEEINNSIDELPSILEKIRIIEEKGLKEKGLSMGKWEYEKILLNKLETDIIEEIQLLENEECKLIRFDKDEQKLHNSSDFKIIENLKSELDKELIINFNEKITLLKTFLEKSKKEKEKWFIKYNKEINDFKKLCEELKESGLNDNDIKNYINLEEKKNGLLILSDELKKQKDEKENIENQRKSLFDELIKIRTNITTKRKDSIRNINSNLKELLNIKLNENANESEYFNWLKNNLTGSGLRSDNIKILSKKIKPAELFKIITTKEDSIEILSGKTELKTNFFEKMLSSPNFKKNIYELEILKIEDSLEIQLNDKGWKPLKNLSTGGKCTAILLIAMLERNIPLLIDQPEDSLDNSFIYNSIVKIIRKLKNKRQLLIVTHNANIPVLGDCEQMFILKSNGLRGIIDKQGSIDSNEIKKEVQNILEGGKEAFKKRYLKYGL